MYAGGLLGQCNLYRNYLFADRNGHRIFGVLMSGDRLAFLQSRLSFYGEETLDEPWKNDRCPFFHEVFEMLNSNF